MRRNLHPLLGPALLLALLTVAAILSRPLTPIDETRYVGVAWEMWLRGDWLVMVKNGEPYSHKPPLLFWLINLGWAVFGVNEWWPRLLSPLFSLGCLGLTLSVARRLWPDDAEFGPRAVWILAASLLWMVFSTATMFDVMLTFFALLGVRGLLLAAEGARGRGFAWLAVAVGFGLLAKGPVILLHLLPVALLAPLWAPGQPWRKWYAGVLLGALGGAAIALAWAIPAALSGGEEYRRMIFWGQTANRMVDSFAHKRAFWWYLLLLPLLLFPWLFWPRLWRGLAALRRAAPDNGLRLCVAWLLPTFVAFSLISGKQVHYLVPLFPAFALVAARLTAGAPPRRTVALAVFSAALFAIVQGAAARYLWQRYDVQPIAAEIRKLQERGIPVANAGEYHAQYQFAGRLERRLDVLDNPAAIRDWFARHPDGVLVHYSKRPEAGPTRFAQPYLNENAALLDADQARALGLIE